MIWTKFSFLAAVLLAASHACWAQQPPTSKELLARQGIDASNDSLIIALASPKPAVRGLAAGQLAENKDVDAIPLLIAAFRIETDAVERLNIAAALDALGDPTGLVDLAAVCNDDSVPADLRIDAAQRTLRTGGVQCLGSAFKLLATETNPAMQAAELYFLLDPRLKIDARVYIESNLVLGLHRALLSEVAITRQKAAECAGRFRVTAEEADLETALNAETDPQVKTSIQAAIQALAQRPPD